MSGQHYVSRFHLSAFCDPASTGTPDPSLWIGSLADQSIRRRSPKNIATAAGLFDGPGGFGEPGASLETFLANEVEGPAATAIEAKDGAVIWEDHFFPEIVDPESGAVLPDGETGELVFTSLTKEALPVIRYRTRDRTRLLPPTARSMRRMAKVMGRTDDMLIIRGVNVFPSQIEELIVGQQYLTPHYKLEVRREGALDHLEVVVERDQQAANVASIREDAARDLQRRIKSYVGVTASVSICNPGDIERSVGKAKRVFDRR
jgi:phenylacetate-CoA ligase